MFIAQYKTATPPKHREIGFWRSINYRSGENLEVTATPSSPPESNPPNNPTPPPNLATVATVGGEWRTGGTDETTPPAIVGRRHYVRVLVGRSISIKNWFRSVGCKCFNVTRHTQNDPPGRYRNLQVLYLHLQFKIVYENTNFEKVRIQGWYGKAISMIVAMPPQATICCFFASS
jgi:hypothetical protein